MPGAALGSQFPSKVGAATGLVGAAGALGGFFPPIALGTIRKWTGSFTPGFVLLSAFSLMCLAVCHFSGERDHGKNGHG